MLYKGLKVGKMVSEKVIRAMKNMYSEKYNELRRNEIEKVLGEEEADRLLRKRKREMLSPEEQKRLDKELLEAVKKGEYKKVEELIKRGANVNEKDNDGWTALMHAASRGHKEIVELLIKNGANVNEKGYNGRTALDYAKTDEIKEILKREMEKKK